ncbi:MAG TPA: autotransporter-associated beta strand repeat-containing protein [Rhizomicrobium sp.]|jgi:autotransporter-associated beta strand protein
MASTKWNAGISGNWSTDADWSSDAPLSGVDATIAAFGIYTVTLSGEGDANSLIFKAPTATLAETATGSLNLAAGFQIDSGTVILRGSNRIGVGADGTLGIDARGGTLEADNAKAFGANELGLTNTTFLGLSGYTFTNKIAMGGSVVTIAAAHGQKLVMDPQSWVTDLDDGGTLNIGQGSNNGTIIWKSQSGSANFPDYTIEINTGTTFKAGDGGFGAFFPTGTNTVVNAGATIDFAGSTGVITDLQGTGTVTSSVGAPSLIVQDGGNFGGTIAGSLALEVSSGTLTLTNASTYTGNTTIDSGAVLMLGSGSATGSIAGDISDNGALVYDQSGNLAVSALLVGSGSVVYEGGGQAVVNRVESYAGGTQIVGETVSTNNAAGFGSGAVSLSNAKLIATASITSGFSFLDLQQNDLIAAAHGTTFSIGHGAEFADGAALFFGDSADDGTIVWTGGASFDNPAGAPVLVRFGTLRAGDAFLGNLLGHASNVALGSTATVDFAGFAGQITGLTGSGHITNRGGAVTTIAGGSFAGVISGATAVDITDGLLLTGTNTYTGGTTIESGTALSLGNGGAQGAVTGSITDNGVLIFDRSGTYTEAGVISGTGYIEQLGSGTLILNQANGYSGTVVDSGVVSIAMSGAIGTGFLVMSGGEVLATAAMQITNGLHGLGNFTLAAATGKQLTFAPADIALAASQLTTMTFGDASHAGIVKWDMPASFDVGAKGYAVDVHSGILKAGNAAFSTFLTGSKITTVESGGTLDIAGFATQIGNLQGSGQIANSGAAAALTLEAANFSGTLGDDILNIVATGHVRLSGSGAFGAEFQVQSGAELDLAGAWAPNVDFVSGAKLDLETPAQFGGVIHDFTTGDVVDVFGINFHAAGFKETYNTTNGQLTLTDGSHTVTIGFDPGAVRANFKPTSDGHGGTDVSFLASSPAVHEVSPPVLASDFHLPVHDWV